MRLLSEISQELRNKITSIIESDTLDFYCNSELSETEKNEIESILLAHDGTETAKLRVHRVLPEDLDPLINDFTILGFRKESPSYDRGRKTQARYMCIEKEEEIVVKTFKDIRDESGILIALEIEFKFFDEDGKIALRKTEIAKKFNKFEAETEERKRRYKQFDYLRASVKGTTLEPHLGALIRHYSKEITEYQDDGLMGLNDAMISETDPTIAYILQVQVPRNDEQGMTNVIKSIQYQIGAISLEDLNV